ncbi:MAG: NAD-dependent DNA ligase LigA [Spirochaetaceae bacterium]|nr:MAG: NAD-dependent DNA ligase LigA [Spirochaetaceae bacterium]
MPSSNTSSNLTPEQARREIDQLSEKLNRYQYEYHVLSRPSVSDREYDRLFDRLLELEKEFPKAKRADSPTQRVGSDLTHELPEVRHTIPVLSLDKAYTAEDLQAWIVKTIKNAGRTLSFVVEEKIDGASIVLYYEEGLLARAVTRGNGLVGNEVTANVKTIRTVPLRLTRPETVAVRGEIFLPRSLFERINADQETPYANPRNLAAGTLRRVKSADVAAIPLDILIYEGYFSSPPQTHVEVLEQLERLGFKLNPDTAVFSEQQEIDRIDKRHPGWTTGGLAEITAYLELARKRRRERDYEIDGLVLKVNELPPRESLGFTGHHPRWAIAFKFEAPEAESVVENIEVQVGRTGRITPVARIKPVLLSGSTISNATLHNQDYVDLLELAIGDRVSVSKRGDVIPAVERVVEKNEQGNTTWKMPDSCPSCGSTLSRQGAHQFCSNQQCPDQIRGRIRFFAGRNQMDIDNLGPETLEVLIERGLVRDVQDLYSFDPQALLDLPGFGEKKVQLIREGLHKSKRRSYRNVLVSLGIPDIGQKAVELLVEGGYRDIDSLLKAAESRDPDTFTRIHGIGEKIARTLIEALNNPEVRRRIEALKNAGLCFSEELPVEPESLPQSFSGQTWCVTGSFENFKPRELAMEEVKRRGGRVTSGVTSKTTHLLAGPGGGSKLEKARELGVQIVAEAEFLKLLVS